VVRKKGEKVEDILGEKLRPKTFLFNPIAF
jgi:hypothetical protein